ncbi:lipopolysaccharide biosynthesis protein [Pseudopedobacter beijingensis]|uniref:Lipopolysaccharide biosynthesis protein n=1 Tax=Pseudopedobacter beijingensis TaxID=1207056 RepID=A0ABW4II07_9SPHI
MYKNALLNTLSAIISLLLNLLVLSLTSRILGAEGRGFYTYFLSYSALVQLFTGIVGNSVMVYMLNRIDEKSVLTLTFFWSIVVSLFSTVLLPCIDTFFEGKLLLFACVTIFQVLHINYMNYLAYTLCFRKVLIFRLTQPLILVSLVSCFKSVNDPEIVLFFLGISYLPSFFSYLRINIRSVCTVDLSRLKSDFIYYFKLGGLNQINNIMQFACYRLVIWLLFFYTSMDSVGVFGIWLSLVEALWLIPVNIAYVNHAYIAKGEKSFNILYVSIISSSIVIFCIIIALITPDSLYINILGKDFGEIKKLIFVSSSGIVMFSFGKILSSFFSAKGDIKYNTIGSAAGLFVTLIFGFYFVRIYGLKGAVLTNTISYIVTTLTLVYLYNLKSRTQD